jgi:hypothetical protein
MNISDAIITHRLDGKEANHLNDFLALGWRILAIKKNQRQDGEGFYEEFGYLIGASNLLEFPEKYTKEIKEHQEWIAKNAF